MFPHSKSSFTRKRHDMQGNLNDRSSKGRVVELELRLDVVNRKLAELYKSGECYKKGWNLNWMGLRSKLKGC
ncbi:hypothetical protein BHE74_00059154 [Ensete ventricosum]|nr:hypothetical protein BHE74_00059154 [Ensete ventricosum]